MVRLLLFCWCVLLQSAFGAEVSLSIESKSLVVGQPVAARVLIAGETATSPPILPDTAFVRASYVGSSSRSRMTPQGITTYTQYNYQVIPLAVGAFELGPVRFEISGQAVETQSVAVKVREAPKQDSLNIVAKAEFVPGEAWEGQVLVYHYFVQSELPIEQAPSWDLDDFDGLRAPRDGDRPQRVSQRELDGVSYQFIERWMPMVVMGRTSRTYRAPIAQVVTRSDANQRPAARLLIGDPIDLTVQPLPATDKDFGGLVGEFQIRSELGDRSVKAGESIPWRITIEGNGTLESYELPKFGSEQKVQVYEGTVTTSATVNDGQYLATMRIERSIIAVEKGVLELPDLVVYTFSPAVQDYVEHRLEFPTVTVAPGAVTGDAPLSFAPTLGEAVELPTPDPIKPPRFKMKTYRGIVSQGWPWLVILLAIYGLFDVGNSPIKELRLKFKERTKPVELPPNASELIGSLGTEPEERLAQVERALRLRYVELTDGDGPKPNEEYERLLAKLQKIRFAEASPENCIEEIRVFIHANAGGTA